MSTCFLVKGGDRIRLTRVDACGYPVYGECNAVVTKAISEIKVSPEVDEKDPKEKTAFDGSFCYSEAQCAEVKYYNIDITWCELNTQAQNIMSKSHQPMRDEDGNIIGGYVGNKLDCGTGYALEIWLQLAGESDACSGEGAEGRWLVIVFDWVTGGAPDDLTFNGTDAVDWTTKGKTKGGGKWGPGPYDIRLDPQGRPAKIPTTAGTGDGYRYFVTTLAPPEVDCDCVEVERPVPPPADVTITGVPGEDPRQTITVVADNHGFGRVSVDFGDGSEKVETNDLTKLLHKYSQAGTYKVKVCDLVDTDVCTEREITVPLASDQPTVQLTCDPANPQTVKADITVPAHARGDVVIDWGDRTDEQNAKAEGGKVTATHKYTGPGRYTVTVRRADGKIYKDRKTITLPCTDTKDKPAAPKA